ncbi:MAG: flagellar basal-body rod protein FlgG [Deltaproteobacteria bacterium]|nr:flagellar basal-body rod protein FlgG [Deltaproteobacteria bacterium]MBK8237938.1 flagellar basal-body rod protein FlgG [Deltaproteobacteria bacterium]MBP7290962.1 flagellar basal-body rod protein FlgG [Nannocystaceae bacterium]
MIRALHTAATGMDAQQQRIDVISNNLANVNTTGFKKQRADFQDLLYQQVRAPGTTAAQGTFVPSGLQVGTGVRTAATHRSFSTGDLQQTGNQLDLAIEGNGFFQVTLPGGEVAFTRAGNFELDQQGQLVTTDGYPVDPAIAIPQGATAVTIGADGTVSATIAGETAASEVGQIQLVNFVNPGGLQAIGRNFYKATTASGDPQSGPPGQQGLGSLAQGFLEMSNVKVVEEMINLISSQRAYEINSKVIQASDEMLQTTANAV